jgi:hypothetical protein
MSSLDGIQNESHTSANYFVEQYKNYLGQIIVKKKKSFLEKRKD